jgi:hypothetical protein
MMHDTPDSWGKVRVPKLSKTPSAHVHKIYTQGSVHEIYQDIGTVNTSAEDPLPQWQQKGTELVSAALSIEIASK